MAKANYAAWHINADDFSDAWPNKQKLQHFVNYAVLAPSGHNTQPWRFAQKGDYLLLKTDYSRRLPYSGVKANEPYVSLGACLGVLQLAALGFGYALSIEYKLDNELIAVVKIGKKVPRDPSLLDAITHRVSNRNYYETKSSPKVTLDSIVRSNFKDVSTTVLTDRNDIAYIAKLTAQATLTTFADKEFRTELSKWVRNNLTKQHDGMPGFAQGIPTPVSMLAKHVIKRLDVSKDQAKKDSNRIIHSGNLVIITIHNPSDAALLDGGRVFSQVCVLAQQQGLATTGAGAAIIDPETTKAMVDKFKLPGRPIAIIRLGKTNKTAKHTPRWPAFKLFDED
jgi:hypothetical protein